MTKCVSTTPSAGPIRALLIMALCAEGSYSTMAQTELPIPPTLSGPVIDLTVQEGTWEFHTGEVVNTYGMNGDLLGPTLILQQGETVTLNVTNTLPDLTTMHWHGLHVSAENDGGPHSLIYPNTTWSPTFTVLDRASTFWYHPHGHGMTDHQVSMGLAGMLIVRDPLEAALALPRTYGVDDVPLILQTKAIVDGQIMLHSGLDSVVVVNGVRNATKELPAQVVRLRCLNGASERAFLLGLSNGMAFHVIGTDGGLLETPVALQRLRLMPGERVELLLDLGGMEGEAFQLMAFNSELPNGIIGSAQVGDGSAFLDGYQENALNGADHALLSFTVGAPTSAPITTLPTALVPTLPHDPMAADMTRTFAMEPQFEGPLELIEGPFEINGALMEMDVINEVVPLGNTEIWEFTNNTMLGHPMHVHDIQFNILDRNGLPPEPWETGWKDVVYVPPMGGARVITQFNDFADPMMPYMYHCHLLMHEDEGMMGQFVVVATDGMAEGQATEAQVRIWPQPWSGGALHMEVAGVHGPAHVAVLDACGRTVHAAPAAFAQGRAHVHLNGLPAGPYVVHVNGIGGTAGHRGRLMVQR